MSYSDWVVKTIDDISEKVFSGGTPSTKNETFWNGKYSWLSSGETRNSFITSTEKTITKEGIAGSSTKLAKKGDLVIASAGQGFTRGQTSFCKIDTYINQSIVAIRCDRKYAHDLFVFYNIKNRYDELRGISDGHSIRGSLTTKLIKNLPISLPRLNQQKAIASILSSLDDKIELNNKINKNLEELAQTLYKRWFVDFEFPNEDGEPYKSSGGEMIESQLGLIPKGWEVKTLTDIANYKNGLAVKKYAANDNVKSIPVLKIKELRNGDCDDNSDKVTLDFPKDYIINNGDLIFSWSGTLMVDFWTGKKAALNQHLFKVESNRYKRWFYYFWTNFHLSKFQNIAAGKATTMGHIKRTDLNKARVLIPDKELYNDATHLFEPIIDKMLSYRNQNSKLIAIRDTILPKLMSGEIEVPIEE